MMMHYVGTGVGHRKPADFPQEVGQLKECLTGKFYAEINISDSAPQDGMDNNMDAYAEEYVAESDAFTEDEDGDDGIYDR